MTAFCFSPQLQHLQKAQSITGTVPGFLPAEVLVFTKTIGFEPSTLLFAKAATVSGFPVHEAEAEVLGAVLQLSQKSRLHTELCSSANKSSLKSCEAALTIPLFVLLLSRLHSPSSW